MGRNGKIFEYHCGTVAEYAMVFRALARGQGLGTISCAVQSGAANCLGRKMTMIEGLRRKE